jgi:rare lipoprotein A
MKLIISLFFFILISCDNISKDKVFTKLENTQNVIQEKVKKNIQKSDDSKKENSSKNKIFYLIGDPYYIEGVKYTPKENYTYQEVGLATYYDKELHNQTTLNNDLNKVTELLGRHKTLPLPSIIKITNLENGLSLTIKIVDRHDDNASIIQVSRKVAQLLRFYKNKIAKVKVEILSDPSKQWKNVTMSINDDNFNSTVNSAPTEIVSISNIDNDFIEDNKNLILEQPIEIGFEEVENLSLYLHVNNFKNYQEIEKIINEIQLTEKYTSENMDTYYKLIIGPIENYIANKLVSTFISKGYKENEIILE